MIREGMAVVAPKNFIIPNITNSNLAGDSQTPSGMMCISGSNLCIWMGSWRYISGMSTAANNELK